MDLKQVLKKAEKVIKKIKSINEKDQIHDLKNEIFEILYPFIISFLKSKLIFNDDSIQNFLLKFFEKLDYIIKSFDPLKGNFYNYLLKILQNILISLNTSQKNLYNIISIDEINRTNKIFFINESEMNNYEIITESKIDESADEYELYYFSILETLNTIPEIDKAIFLLYYYEYINSDQMIFLAKALKKTVIEINNLLIEFREKNLNKYKLIEKMKKNLNKVKCNDKKKEVLKKLNNIKIYGDVETIAKLFNISPTTVRVKITRIKEKIFKKSEIFLKNFKYKKY